MARENKIKVITIGEITEEMRRNCAKTVARALVVQYGKQSCENILRDLKISKER